MADYRDLRFRELAIVLAADLDAALAELLYNRLIGDDNELIELLGANEDGRAVGGSFGARIQLARAVGILRVNEAQTLRILKKIRNLVAHRVKISYSSQQIQMSMEQLHANLMTFSFDDGATIAEYIIKKWTGKKSHAKVTNLAFGRRVLIGSALTLQLAFLDMLGTIKRIEIVETANKI